MGEIMRLIRRSLEILGVFAVLAFQATPSAAQLDAVFLRSDGSDALTCANVQNRCISLARGLDQVNAGGTVNVLDSNVHAAIEIGVGVSIFAPGGGNIIEESGIGSPSSAIYIHTAPADVVTISGVSIDQRGLLNHGLTMDSSGVLHLENCYIRGSGDLFGLNIIPFGAVEVHISNCVIADNGGAGTGGGILIKPSGSGSAKVVLDNVRVENNLLGINIDGTGTSGALSVTVHNSIMSNNTAFGIKAIESGAGSTNVMLESSTASNNGTNGVIAVGGTAIIRMRNSTSTANAAGLVVSSGGQIVSHGGNVVAGQHHQRLVHRLVRAAIG